MPKEQEQPNHSDPTEHQPKKSDEIVIPGAIPFRIKRSLYDQIIAVLDEQDSLTANIKSIAKAHHWQVELVRRVGSYEASKRKKIAEARRDSDL
jgi:hypothetical protein